MRGKRSSRRHFSQAHKDRTTLHECESHSNLGSVLFFFFAFVTPIRVSCNYRTTKVLLIETAPKFFKGKLCDLCKNDFWVQVSQINIQTNFNLSECFLKCSYERRNSTPPLWSSGPVFLNLCQWFDQHSAQFEHDSSNLLSWRYKGSNK